MCKTEYHTPICYCPAGLQGNPQVSCIEVKCSTHQDCGTNQICDYPSFSSQSLPSYNPSKECVDLCVKSPCAPNAICTASNHRETCACRPPLIGDGYASCAERKKFNFENIFMNCHDSILGKIFFNIAVVAESPECRVDRDCPSKLACIQASCQNPCVVNSPCTATQQCVVVDSLPSRSVACICPEGSVLNSNGQCSQGISKEKLKNT